MCRKLNLTTIVDYHIDTSFYPLPCSKALTTYVRYQIETVNYFYDLFLLPVRYRCDMAKRSSYRWERTTQWRSRSEHFGRGSSSRTATEEWHPTRGWSISSTRPILDQEPKAWRWRVVQNVLRSSRIPYLHPWCRPGASLRGI